MKNIELIIYVVIFIAAVFLIVKHWKTGKRK